MLLVSVIDNNKSIAKEIARMCTCRVNRENETDYNAECKNWWRVWQADGDTDGQKRASNSQV